MSEIAESFASALSELTVNSKPHINMLTMLSDDHLDYAPIITQTVFNHLQKVNIQLIFFHYLLTGGLLKMSNVFHTWQSNSTANACLNLYQITIVVYLSNLRFHSYLHLSVLSWCSFHSCLFYHDVPSTRVSSIMMFLSVSNVCWCLSSVMFDGWNYYVNKITHYSSYQSFSYFLRMKFLNRRQSL